MITNKSDIFISAVIYLHNNDRTVKEYLENLHSYLNERYEHFEIILVDDNSSDKTIEQINLSTLNSKKAYTLIKLSYRQGLEQAMKAGIDFAIGDYVLQIDNIEIGYDSVLLDDMAQAISNGNDIVFLAPKKQSLISKIFYKILSSFNKFNADFKSVVAIMITRRGLNLASKINDKLFFRQFFYNIIGFSKETIYFDSKNKHNSQHKLRDKIRLAFNLLFSFTDLGLKIDLSLCGITFLMAVYFGWHAIDAYFSGVRYMILLIISMTMSYLFILFAFLAIIIKYFEILIKEAKSLPKYTIEEIRKIN